MRTLLSAVLVLVLSVAECAAGVAISDDGSPSARYAADELREHLRLLHDHANELQVSIAISDDKALGDDGFEIKSADGVVSVRGGKRGVIYGVYELLERYGGVMWLSPDYTHIPTNGSFSVPANLHLREKPLFEERLHDTFDYRSLQAFAVRSRLNEGSYGEKFGGAFPPFDEKFGKCHTLVRMLPPDEHYDAHPEYYSLVKGKRLKVRPQLCLTNPDVFAIALSNVLARIAANANDPDPRRRATRYYGLSQADWNNYCECENCAAIDAREESHSGCVIWFVNKIAEEVEKKHPEVMIETLAYMYSRKPPKNLKPRDNVMICLCSIECDFSKPMVESRYRENVAFREDLLKWRDIAKHLYLWDYAANWRATPVPYPNLKAYAKNMRFYYEAGVRHLFEEGFRSGKHPRGSIPSASFTDLKGWLGAKLMWNPFQPAAPLVRRFCYAYYGKAAPIVLDFIRLMQEQEIDETKTPLTYAVTLDKMPFTKDFYVAGRELWVKAEDAVADEPEPIRRHVAWGRFGLEYALSGLYRMGEWKPLILSRETAAKLDRSEYLKMRESARYCQRLLDSDSGAMVSSRLNDARIKGHLKALAHSDFPDVVPTIGLMQDWAFIYDDFPKSKTISREKDKDATDGSVILVKGEKNDRSVFCHVKSVLALDRGCRYRMRARIKVQPRGDLPAGGPILSMELFDVVEKKRLCASSVPSGRATDAYEWYDFGEWTDTGHGCRLNINPKGSTFSLDCVEVERMSDELPTSKVEFSKPTMRWLWGGFGFHNSEATMTPLMSEEFRDQRVLKTFREISPTYSRVFAGYWDWTQEAMDRFADYYDATFRLAGTTLYIVPGRMPVITDDFDAKSYCEAVATRLEYLVKKRKCTKIRYYCLSNELSVGPTYAWFGSHLDVYAAINREMQKAFARHGLDIGLQTPDSSGYSRMSDIDWAIANINEQTDTYCWHLYERNLKPGDPMLYTKLHSALTNLVSKALRKEKRLSLGEFGFTGKIMPYGQGAMRDDGHDAFRNPGGEFSRCAAISRAEMGLTALNAGAVSAVSWTMVDYPDPFLREDGDSAEEKARYDVARFSGFGLDVRYNKNGLFRWCDDEHDYSSYPDLYTMGYLVKLFRKGARVLPWTTTDDTLRAGGVTNPNGTVSFAVINWGAAKKVALLLLHPIAKPLRVYEYDSAHPPFNEFNDLQPAKGLVAATDGTATVSVPARSMVFLTTDYIERTPAAVADLRLADGVLRWKASEEPEHCYYRVYRDGKQIASTVATSLDLGGTCAVSTADGTSTVPPALSVRSVDKWGNEGLE